MTRTKEAVKYQGFALPVPFIEKIKRHIKNKDQFRSVTDYVRYAINLAMDVDNGKIELPRGFAKPREDSVLDMNSKEFEERIKQIIASEESKKKKSSSNGNGHGLE